MPKQRTFVTLGCSGQDRPVHLHLAEPLCGIHCAKSLQGKAPCGGAVYGSWTEMSPAPSTPVGPPPPVGPPCQRQTPYGQTGQGAVCHGFSMPKKGWKTMRYSPIVG